VKIVQAYSNGELGSYFIHSGDTLSIKVPTGSYEIKYATGQQWYGSQYSGYTVELIMQQNGNLRTSNIQAQQW